MRQDMSEARAKWRELICEQSQSGQSVSAFCRERELRVWQFYEWKKRVRDCKPEQFVEVRVAARPEPEQPAQRQRSSIEIRLSSGRSLVVGAEFDASHLRALLAVLEPGA
jgi:hypothetical protein